MKTLFFALLGLVMVIVPQLITLWHRYLIYLNSPFNYCADTPRAEIVYEATVKAGEINSKWNNRTLNSLKRKVSALGTIILIATFILAFGCQPDYFFLTIDSILIGLCWIYLETVVLNFCYKQKGLDKVSLWAIALSCPLLVVFISYLLMVSVIKLYVYIDFDIELFNRVISICNL